MLQNRCFLIRVHIPSTNPPTEESLFLLYFLLTTARRRKNLIIVNYCTLEFTVCFDILQGMQIGPILPYCLWMSKEEISVAMRSDARPPLWWFSASDVKYTVAANLVKFPNSDKPPLLPRSQIHEILNLTFKCSLKNGPDSQPLSLLLCGWKRHITSFNPENFSPGLGKIGLIST